jgi:pimeloyl-ACP methyl ester carboxylesterase
VILDECAGDRAFAPIGATVSAGRLEAYYDRRGEGPEVLLIAGLGDPAEAWEAQLTGLSDRYTVTAGSRRRQSTGSAN